MIEGLTPTQWAALAKLAEVGACSQNNLGRLTAMDAATIKGVIDRLAARGFARAAADSAGRAAAGHRTDRRWAPRSTRAPRRSAREITATTLAPLDEDERRALVALLRRLT